MIAVPLAFAGLDHRQVFRASYGEIHAIAASGDDLLTEIDCRLGQRRKITLGGAVQEQRDATCSTRLVKHIANGFCH